MAQLERLLAAVGGNARALRLEEGAAPRASTSTGEHRAVRPSGSNAAVALVRPPLSAGDPSIDAARERIDELLEITIARGASDLHLRCGQAPILRVHGVI